jgi:putative oxidoreductase
MQKYFISSRRLSLDFPLLIVRLALGAMMAFGHGVPKLNSFAQRKDSFPEIFGMDSSVTLILAIFAEVFCSFLLAVGLLTRTALIFLIATMLVAVLLVHGDDPFSKQEVGLLYLVPYFFLYLTGPGKYSIDNLILKK